MEINRQNYEAFFLDYIEGKMNNTETARLMDFLSYNPDLKAELKNFELITLVPEPDIFKEKDLLKKSIENFQMINESNFIELCIARIEGDLGSNAEKLFDSYLEQYPGKLQEYNLYYKTILKPDRNIVFSEKRKLKHLNIVPQKNVLYRTLTAAASVILLIFAYKFNFGFHEVEKMQVSGVIKNESKAKEVKNEKKTIVIKNLETPIVKSFGYQPVKMMAQVQKQVLKYDIQMQLQKSLEPAQLKAPGLQEKPLISENRVLADYKERSERASNKDNKFLTLDKLAENEIMKTIKSQNLPIEHGIDLWTLAKSGVIGINRIFGSKIVLNNTKDTITNRSRFELNTGLLGFYSSSQEK